MSAHRPPALRVLVAILVTAAAVALRWLIQPWLGNDLRFITVFGAVAAAVWYGGAWPALLASVLGYIGTLFVVRGIQGRVGPFDPVVLALYLATCGVIIAMGEATRRAQRRAERAREQLRVTLASIGDAVISTDTDGRVVYLNAVAEALTGWSTAEAAGLPLDQVFRIIEEATRGPAENPVARALAHGLVVGLTNHTLLLRRDGSEVAIDDSAAPIREPDGTVRGVVLVFREVTERRRLERLQQNLQHELESKVQERTAALEASEERFRLLVEGSQDYAIFMLDPQGNVVSWNPGAERIKQYRAEEIVGQHFSRFYPPEDVERGKPARELEIAAASGKYEEEGWRLRKDGSRFWASVVITALRDAAGNLRGFGKLTRDMTERKRTEETARQLAAEAARRQEAERSATELERERESLRVTLASIGDAVIATDAKGRITFLNPVAERLTGWSSTESAGQPLTTVFRIINELTRQVVEDPVAKVLRLGEVVGLANHTVLIRKDGSERPIDDSAAPIKDAAGRLHGVVLVFRDITARRRLDREIAERLASEERLRLATQAGRVGVWEWDIAANRVSWTDLIYEIHGVGRDEFDGTVEGFAALVHPADQATVRAAIERTLRDDAPYEVEFRAVKPSGETIWIQTTANVVRQDGRPVRMIGTTIDATERKRAEQLLHQRAVALEEADRRKDQFLATLAHELRNPLAPIQNAVQVLKASATPTSELDWSRGVIDRQVKHMSRLLEDLLDLSRISRGMLGLRRERLELAQVIETALETSRPHIEGRGHRLEVRVPEAPCILEADPIRLAQILSNLLNNAARYTEPGGRLQLTAECHGKELVLSVRDNGIGIAPEVLPRVFDMFTQARPSWETAQAGLGIGLSLVRGLVELHGGTVEAKSAGPGQGSEFLLRVPIVVQDAGAPESPGKRERRRKPRARRVLIVDDLRDSADTLAMVLQLAGHEIQTAYDGATALATAERFRPNVVLLDIGMPKLNGYDVARELRATEWGRTLTLVALTGWGHEQDRRRTELAGFDHHLVKPVDPAQLEALFAGLRER